MPPQTLTPGPDPIQYQCRHIKPDGQRCGSPALRHEPFCYYHHTTRRPNPGQAPRQPHVTTATARKSSTFDLPSPADLADRAGIQLAIALLLHKIAGNEIDPRRAGLLLYGLQIASTNLKQERSKQPTPADPVEEITEDPTHGPLAPETEFEQSRAVGPMTALLRTMERREREEIEARTRAEQATPLPRIQANAATPNRACRRAARKRLRHELGAKPSSPALTFIPARLCRKTTPPGKKAIEPSAPASASPPPPPPAGTPPSPHSSHPSTHPADSSGNATGSPA